MSRIGSAKPWHPRDELLRIRKCRWTSRPRFLPLGLTALRPRGYKQLTCFTFRVAFRLLVLGSSMRSPRVLHGQDLRF